MAIRGYTAEVQAMYERALELAEEAGGHPRAHPGPAEPRGAPPVPRRVRPVPRGRAPAPRDRRGGAAGPRAPGRGPPADRHEPRCRSATRDARARAPRARRRRCSIPTQHGTGRFRLGPSPGVTPHTSVGVHPVADAATADQARRHAAQALEVADRLGQPYTLAYARFHVGLLNAWERRWETVHELATRRPRDRRGARLPRLEGDLARPERSRADRRRRARRGHRGERRRRRPVPGHDGAAGLLAADPVAPRATLAHVGRPGDGLDAVDQAIAVRRGRRLNVLAPQFPALRGDLLLALGDATRRGRRPTGPRSTSRSAPALGCRSSRRRSGSCGCRATATRDDALGRLRELHATFTEGFDAPDVVAARELLGS